MRNNLILSALILVLTTAFGANATAGSFSNRHHLSGCTAQSAPVVIPFADVRTVRLGLPADLDGQPRIDQIYGYDEETRLRLRRRGVSLHTQGGGAVLTMPQQSGC